SFTEDTLHKSHNRFVSFTDEHGHLKIYLPKKLLECLPKCSSLPKERHRWNTNEEIAAYLITFEKHEEWLTTSPKTRPQNGSMILYNRKKVKYRKDGYCWKKRKDGKTTREDHMKLKVQGVECLYGCYVHSSIIPTFHRRCYWLLQMPPFIILHYLMCWRGAGLCGCLADVCVSSSLPAVHGIKWTCSNGNSSTGFSAEQLVQQILDSHQTKPPPRTHNCLCTGNLGAGSSLHHKCNSAKHRIISPKVDPRTGGAYSSTHSEVQNNDVSEGKTEHSHGGGKNGRAGADGTGGTGGREKRNGKVHKPGGVKVLITGPWQEASSEYTCLFDQITVPASLIQPGVLRCYCPAHDTGLVTLQVAASSQIISNSVVFEYKARALPALPSSQHDWLSLDDNQFRMSILERLEQMERRMAEMAGQVEEPELEEKEEEGQGPAGNSFESRVVVVCEKMMNRACWAKSKHLIHSKTFRGMTLLHLAAAQGYTTLIQTLIKWRTKHADSIDLELEVDPLNVDHFSCTPLMWACALGHMEAAVVLYKWDRRALAIPDSLGRLPLAIARSRGHTKLAECLESLQREEQQSGALNTTPSMPFSPSTETSQGDGEQSQTKLGSTCGGGSWGSRQAAGRRVPTVGLGKERLANRLRLREIASAGTISDLRTTQEDLENAGGLQNMNMMTLAEEVIEATSDRIKRENFVASETTLDGVGVSSTMSWLASYLGDPELDGSLGKLGLQTPAEWTALLNASHNKEERDLTQLALSDPEQRELYEAARQVQNTFRKYKGRPLREQQELAAAVIQRCYKRYKQLTWIALKYALYKKMTLAAILIQSKFRSYHEQKKFQQSRRAAMLIQQYYRSYKELGRPNPCSRATAAALVQQKLSLLTKRQDQAARKIMRFLLRCRHR
uniref:Calmodulin-binding transcription activator 1 n=1 Tax=Cyprinus carpio TaxID=7962 RepID=A0A8C1XKB6_CYPCA